MTFKRGRKRGYTHSEETKRKMSDSQKEIIPINITKQKISDSNKKRWKNDIHLMNIEEFKQVLFI